MKLFVITTFIGLLVGAGAIAPHPGAAQTLNLWSKGIGGPAFDQTGGVALDAFGNVFATGAFQGTVNFGGGNLVSAGERDVFLVKYAADGTHLWSQRFGDANPDIPYAIAVDAWGNVAIVGGFYGAIDFGEGNALSAGDNDVFVTVFDPDGTLLWNQNEGSTQNDYANAVAFDASGSVIVSGGFHGTVNFGGGNLVSAGDLESFFVRYDNNGTHQWSQRFGSTGADVGAELALDAAGDIIFGGLFSNTVDFGGGNLVSAGQVDIVLAKYSVAGVHQWSQSFGSAGSELMEGVSVGASGDICITGSFENTADFGGGGLVSAGASDIVLAQFTAAGTHVWSQRFGGVDYDRGYALDRHASGNIVVTGRFMVSADFGGGTRVALGGGDTFVAQFGATGTYVSDDHYGIAAEDNGRDIKADDAGGIVVMGYYGGTINFGTGPLSNAGSDDVFVARFANGVEDPSITAVVDVGNDDGRRVQITFDRSVHDAAGSPTQVVAYEVYRRDNAPPSSAVARVAGEEGGPFTVEGWTFVASAPAHGEAGYNIVAPTIGDSTIAGGLYESVFFIRAATSVPTVFYDSAPDSGYSIDNLAPPAPTSVTYNTGLLSWDDSAAPDLDYFLVYGSGVNDFASAVPLGETISTALDVSGAPYPYYFVTATDFAGNESDPGSPATATAVGTMPSTLGLRLAAHPNPFNPSTAITFTVPTPGQIQLRIYDARGAHVSTLIDGLTYAAGEYSMPWHGRNGAGHGVRSGVYFVRVDHRGVTQSQKLVLLK